MNIETWISIGGAILAVAVATVIFGPQGIVYNVLIALGGGALATAIYRGSKKVKDKGD